MPKVFWFSRLQPGITPEAYEQFVREVDYPAVERIPSIIRYYSLHVNGPAMGSAELPYDFVDIVEVTDIEAYRRDLEEHPAALEVHGQSGKYVETIGTLWAEMIEPEG